MKFTIFTGNCIGQAYNTKYPNEKIISSADEMDQAIIYDHVCAKYEDNIRNSDNFIESDVVVMDCDNDHSENPADWATPQKLEGLLGDVAFVTAPSRHDNMAKDEKSARPRFHVYFPINTIESDKAYAALKKHIHQVFNFFDGNALDAGRFIFGSDRGSCFWHDGWLGIDEVIDYYEEDNSKGIIPEGCRNNTLSRYASRVLKRYGDSERALNLFQNKADTCDPPLEEAELKSIWNSAVKFLNKKVVVQDTYVSPEKFNNDFQGESLRPSDYSDIGQAKVLAKEYADELRYTDATDYIRYDGQKWIESNQQAIGAAEDFLDLQLSDAETEVNTSLENLESMGVAKAEVRSKGRKLLSSLNEKQAKELLRYLSAKAYFDFVMQRRNMKYVTSALSAAKPMLQLDVTDLDANEFLLNTLDGTYDLRLGLDGRKEHDPGDLITKQTAVPVGDDGKDLWEDSLNLIFQSDTELINYVQEIIGLAAIGKVYVEALIIAHGDGSNGKSTFWNTISKVLGTYSGSISADALTVGCKRNVKPEIAELKGKRFVIAAELEEGMRLNTSIIKQLCSTDEVAAEKKYKDPFKFTPAHTLVLYTNHLPRVGANDAGTWRRLIVIPFNASISDSSDIKNYGDYLFQNAGPAVLKWIIEGAQRVISKNFKLTYPQCVKDAIKAYRENNDWLGIFIKEECEIDPTFKQKSGEFYQEYRAYCAKLGEYARSTTDFYSALEIAGFTRKKTKTGNFINGIRLKEDLFA